MSKRLIALAAILVACLASMMALGGSPASAQEDDATYQLQIQVLQCETADICEAGDGENVGDATVYVTSEDGSIDYGTCVTTVDGVPGGCTIDVDPGTTIAASVDAASIPDGYVSLEDPVIYEVPAEKEGVGDFSIVLTAQEDTVPDDADTDEEVIGDEEAAADDEVSGAADATPSAELPSTGSNPDNGSTTSTPLMLLGAIAALAVLVSGGLVITRRAGNQNQ